MSSLAPQFIHDFFGATHDRSSLREILLIVFGPMVPLGTHRILDYWGCSFETLDNLDGIRTMFDEALRISNATVINIVMHKFAPQGVTGIASIAESHVSIHTWPELGYAAVDVFSCGTTMNTDALLGHFEKCLEPTDKTETSLARGERLRLAQTP